MYSDDDEEEPRPHEWGGVAARALLVDVSHEGRAPVALGACLALVRDALANAPRSSLVGLAAYGTLRGDERGLERVAQLHALAEPSCALLGALVDCCDDDDKIGREWGSSRDFDFGDALWRAARMFSACKRTMSERRVTVFGRFDREPPDAATERAALRRAADLKALGVELELVNVGEAPLNPDGFYARLLAAIADDDDDIEERRPLPEPCSTVEEALLSLRASSHSKRASAKIKFELGPGVALGVGLYHPVRAKAMPKKVPLRGADNAEVFAVQSTVLADGGETESAKPLLQGEMCAYQTFGGANVELTRDELAALRKFAGAPGLRLIGFKPASALSARDRYLQPCTFLYPDEGAVAGSTTLFRCLRDRCLAKECVAVCALVSRWYSHPKLVALVPQTELVRDRRQIVPDGFHVVYLPYAENMRDITVEPSDDVSEERLAIAERVAKKLRFEFTCDSFENPKLGTFYRALEALALGRPATNPTEDTTRPDVECQRERLGPLADAFEGAFGPFGQAPSKRKNENGGAEPKRRQVEAECPDIPMLAARVSGREVHKYTVAQLRQILKWRDRKDMPALTGAKKDLLVELVYKHCSDV